MQHIKIIVVVGVLTAALGACKKGDESASAAAAQKAAPPCPRTYKELPDAEQPGQKTCACAPNAPRGTVWGTGTYTRDSVICAAAIHAGVITDQGGAVTLVPGPGCEAYESSTANGVTTEAWGAFPGSFSFAGKTAACAKPAAPPVPVADCPATFNDIAGRTASTSLTCRCAASPAGTVWGTGIYTLDSSLCAAAVHAGVIPAAGGQVTVQAAPACDKYDGSAANGVTTNAWGHYDGSFVFAGKSAACPTP